MFGFISRQFFTKSGKSFPRRGDFKLECRRGAENVKWVRQSKIVIFILSCCIKYHSILCFRGSNVYLFPTLPENSFHSFICHHNSIRKFNLSRVIRKVSHSEKFSTWRMVNVGLLYWKLRFQTTLKWNDNFQQLANDKYTKS